DVYKRQGLNYWLIPEFGYIAAAYTTLFSYVLLFIFHYINAKFIMKKNIINFKNIFLDLLMVLVLLFVYLILFSVLSNFLILFFVKIVIMSFIFFFLFKF
ncbi:MAG: polysaccharide biosynthesis protein, partial [Halanaerobium sp.]